MNISKGGIVLLTFLAVVFYLAVTQPQGTKTLFTGTKDLYVGAVRALQGRG